MASSGRGVRSHACTHVCTHIHTAYINSRISGHFSIYVHPHKIREALKRLQELPLTLAPQRPDETMYALGSQFSLTLIKKSTSEFMKYLQNIGSDSI